MAASAPPIPKAPALPTFPTAFVIVLNEVIGISTESNPKGSVRSPTNSIPKVPRFLKNPLF